MLLTHRISLITFINLLRYDREWVSTRRGLIASTQVKLLTEQPTTELGSFFA